MYSLEVISSKILAYSCNYSHKWAHIVPHKSRHPLITIWIPSQSITQKVVSIFIHWFSILYWPLLWIQTHFVLNQCTYQRRVRVVQNRMSLGFATRNTKTLQWMIQSCAQWNTVLKSWSSVYIAVGRSCKFARNENVTFPVILWLGTRYAFLQVVTSYSVESCGCSGNFRGHLRIFQGEFYDCRPTVPTYGAVVVSIRDSKWSLILRYFHTNCSQPKLTFEHSGFCVLV